MAGSYKTTAHDVLSRLEGRTRDIVEDRFGLSSGAPKTLEAIGDRHGVTRERVRQIVEDGLRQIRKDEEVSKKEPVREVFRSAKHALKKRGSVAAEWRLVRDAQAEREAPHFVFLLHLDEGMLRSRETRETHAFWTDKREFSSKIPTLLRKLAREIEKQNDVVDDKTVNRLAPANPHRLSSAALFSALEASKLIMRGYDGRWGMRNWPQINPRGVREKAYLVLKEEGRPMHFRDIAEGIKGLQQRLPISTSKQVLPQTVHNELIKDDRFVLVGRGIYGLAEWGYLPGTVKEVIAEILKKSSRPLTRGEIIEELARQRQVKESTVILNLQDRRSFAKDAQGRYYRQQ